MIFKAKNDWGNTGVRSGISGIGTFVDKIKSSFNPQQRFNEADTKAINNYVAEVERLKGLQTSVENFNGSIKESIIYKKAFDNTMQDQSEEAQTFVRGLQNGTEKLDNMTKASKAAELGMNALAMAGNMLASFLISSFISLLVNVANASDEIADSAAQIGTSFKETTSDLDDYKTKVDELRNTIDDSSSSIADVQNARKELMSIQDDLIEKYGTEESVVKSITDAVNGEANAWDQLKKKKWTQAKNEFNDTGKDGILKGFGRNISNFFNGYTNNTDRMKKEYGDYSVDISTGNITGYNNQKQAEKILSKFGKLTNSDDNLPGKQLTIEGNAEEVYNTLLNIQSVFNDLNNDSIGKNSSFVTELGNMANAADEVVQKYQDFWTEYVLNEEILSKGSKYTSDYKDIINDYNDYQKAVENGDKETVKETKQALVESISGAMDEALKNGDEDVLSFFQNMYPDLKSEVESWRFDIDFEANTNGLEEKVKNPVKVLEDFSSDELKSDVFDPNTVTKAQKDAYNTLIGVATQYGLTIDELIEKLQKMGLLSSDAEKLYSKTLNRFEKAGSKSKKKNVDVAEENLQNEYDKITGKNGRRDFQLGAYEKQLKNGTIQSKYGNVDMDHRQVIQYDQDYLKKHKDVLESWVTEKDKEGRTISTKYSEVADAIKNGEQMVDTVWGRSERFGEDLNGTGWEIAFTPILPNGTFLSSDTVHDYINDIVQDAYADDGKVTDDELKELDAQGRYIGDTFVQGIYAGVDDSLNYDNNGNWAEVVGRLMHFSGDSGAVSLAKKGIEKAKKLFGQDDQSKIESFLKSEGLTSTEDIEFFNKVTADAKDAAEAIKMYNDAKKEKKEADKEDSTTQYGSFKEGWKDLGKTSNDTQTSLKNLAKAGQLTKATFEKVSGAKKWAKQFETLGLSTQDIIDKINKMQSSADQLSSMKSGISGISEILGQKKENLSKKKTKNTGIGADVLAGLPDEVKKSKKEYEEFCETLGDGNSDMNACQKAANKLATAYVNSNDFLAKLNNNTKDYYISELKEMGVENAKTVVQSILADKTQYYGEKKQFVEEKSKSLVQATSDEINKFIEEQGGAEKASTALLELALEKESCNEHVLDFSGDCTNLLNYVTALNGAHKALEALQAAQNHDWDTVKKLGYDPSDTGAISKLADDAKKEIEDARKKQVKTNVSTTVKPTTPSGSNSKKSKKNKNKNKSKDSKQEIDWIARKLEVLQKAIDTTSGKLQNLFSIKAKKSNINEQITETTALLNANRKAAKAYTTEASKVKLGGKLKAKVRSGNYDITKYDSKTADKINKYQDLIDKAREAQDAIQDNIASISDLNQQKLDNITTWYDKLLEKINAVTSKLQAKTDLTSKVRGMLGQAETGTKTEYTNTLKNQKSALKTSQTELKKYEAERKAQRKKLTGQTNSKNKSDRQTTKEFLQRSGLSKKEIAKELKKFDTQRGKLKDKQLDDFDATTKTQSAKLKENVYSGLSDMLDTAQSLANIPLEKLNTSLDKLSSEFDGLEKRVNRVTQAFSNSDSDADLKYLEKLNKQEVSNKSEAYTKANDTYKSSKKDRDSLSKDLKKRGIDTSEIKTSDDFDKFFNQAANKGDYTSVELLTQWLAKVKSTNEAQKTLNSTMEDYQDVIYSTNEAVINAKDESADRKREKTSKENERRYKEYDATDATLKDRLDTEEVKVADSGKEWQSYLDQAEERRKSKEADAEQLRDFNTFARADNGLKYLVPLMDTIQWYIDNDQYIPQDLVDELVKGNGVAGNDAINYNLNKKSEETAKDNGKDAEVQYKYEDIPQYYQNAASLIADDAERSANIIQEAYDDIDQNLENDLLTNKADSYKKEADLAKQQQSIHENEYYKQMELLQDAKNAGFGEGTTVYDSIYDKAQAAKDNMEKDQQTYTSAMVNSFNAIGDAADRSIQVVQDIIDKLDRDISKLETQGHYITSDFYTQSAVNYTDEKQKQLQKAQDLQTELDRQMNDPDNPIEVGSERWYEMKDKIDAANKAAEECDQKIAECTKNARDAIFEFAEKSRDAISQINEEADFYQGVLGHRDTVNEKTGAFTEAGVATIALSFEKMSNDMVINDKINKERDRITKLYQNGTNPDYGLDAYNQDMEKLLSQQHEAINNYYEECDAIKSLVQDGYQKQLDALQKLVDKYKEVLNKQDDLRSYNNTVEEQTKNIASIKKQIEATMGNDTEEGRANIQSLQKQLEDAQKELDDTEWDKHKSDVEEILDDMLEDAQDFIDDKLDQLDETLESIRDALPDDASLVHNTLSELAEQWGIKLSDALNVSTAEGDYGVITDSITSAAEKIAQAIYDINTYNMSNDHKSSGSTGLLQKYSMYMQNVGTDSSNSNSVDNSGDDGVMGGAGGSVEKLNTLTKNYFGKVLSDQEVTQAIIDLLGFSEKIAKTIPLRYQRAMLYDELHFAGFAKGGIVGKINEQVRKNNDDAIISVQSGEGILTPQQTEMFQKLVGELPSLVSIADVKVPNLPIAQNTSKTVNVELGDMHFDLPNVTDTDSFINAWKTDNKMKNFVSDVVAGAVTGDNSKAMRY